MTKVERTETEDGKYKFEISRDRSLLIVVFGSAYGHCRIVRPDRDGVQDYLDFAMETLQKIGDSEVVMLPKIRHYDDNDLTDNEIEIYELYP